MADLDVEFEPPLAWVRINSPERRNAMSRAMWLALADAVYAIEARPDALAVLVQGSGGHFCAGADISEFPEVYRDAAATHDYVDAIQIGLGALAALDRPTIAALCCVAIGGGLGLALCCDLRFCAEDASLAITPAKLGLLYGHLETRRLVELVGPARAKDLLFSGRRVEPSEALAIGLVDRLAPAGELMGAVHAYAADLARLSQRSIRGAKRAVDAIALGMPRETPAFRRAVEDAALGDDFLKGRTAFAEKRAPTFAFRGPTLKIE